MPKASVEVDDLNPEKDLEKEPKKEPEAKKEASEPKYVTTEELEAIRKQFNGISSTLRHLKDLPAEIAALKETIASPVSTKREREEAKDELDELVEKGEWKTAVKKLANEEAQAILKAEEEQRRRRMTQDEQSQRLEQNKQVVMERYPDLADPESELTQRFIKVRNENPHFNYSTEGPLLAMYKMEEELRQEGKLDQFTKKIVDKEVLRQTRAGASSIGRTSPGGNGNKIVLTAEQKAFCDASGLKYESYAKNLRSVNQTKNVEA